jgi:hypothetical protein
MNGVFFNGSLSTPLNVGICVRNPVMMDARISGHQVYRWLMEV